MARVGVVQNRYAGQRVIDADKMEVDVRVVALGLLRVCRMALGFGVRTDTLLTATTRHTLGIGGVVVTKYERPVLVDAGADCRRPLPSAPFSSAPSAAASPSTST
jgi:hypothetical protein